jgi:thiamine biosynthesis protein ThiS
MIEQTIRVTLNGEPRTVAAGLTLPALLEQLEIDPRLIALAHNGEVIPRDSYSRIILNEGDRIEVVRMVGGG